MGKIKDVEDIKEKWFLNAIMAGVVDLLEGKFELKNPEVALILISSDENEDGCKSHGANILSNVNKDKLDSILRAYVEQSTIDSLGEIIDILGREAKQAKAKEREKETDDAH